MSIETVYSVSSTATGGGRDGHVSSTAGHLNLDLRPPKELGGDGTGANPEELFSAGYAACFLSALQAIARQKKITLPTDTIVTVEASVGRDLTDKGFGLAIAIEVSIPGWDKKEAQTLAEDTDNFCPYSKATKGNIDSAITVKV